jgi:hypothetical protein
LVFAEPLEVRRLLSSTIYVDATAPGNNSGTSWQNAFTDLQSALSAARGGTTIEVSQGTYYPTSGTDRDATFNLINGVTLEGGFAGYGTKNPNTQDIALYPSTLSGNLGTPGDNSDNSYNVLVSNNNDATAVLNGFTIIGGNANGYSGGAYDGGGGGMNLQNGSPTITNCTFTDDFGFYGGALFIGNSQATLTDCIFSGDSGGDPYGGAGGGAAFCANASPTFVNCLFINNQSTNFGGALDDANSTVTAINCTFADNSGNTGSAVVDAFSGGTTLTNCILWGDSGSAEIVGDFFGYTSTTATYSDVDGGYSGDGNINVDPEFVTAPGPGANDLGDLQLQAGSPCIDAGNVNAVPPDVGSDLAGNNRTVAGTVDMGAYEHSAPSLDFTQQPTNSVAGAAIPSFDVTAENKDGSVNTQAGETITLSIASGPAGAKLSGTTSVQAQNGVAVFSNISANIPGQYVLTASDNHGLTGKSQQFAVSPAQIAFTHQPGNATAGSPLGEVVVDVENQAGKPYAGDSAPVTLSIASGPDGAAISGKYTVNTVNGVAVFHDVFFDMAGSYTITADGENKSVTSHSFTVAPGSIANLTFTQPPSETAAGAPNSPAIVVTAVDAFGNLIAQPLAVTLSVASGPAGGKMKGVHTANLFDGVVTFNDISFTVAGTYTLKATAGPVSTVSGDFNIDPLAPTKLVFAPFPPGFGVGEPISPIVVEAIDGYGNLTTDSEDSVTISVVSGPSGATLTGSTTVESQNGVATFDNLTLSVVGTYTFKAVLGDLPTIVSSPVYIGPGAAATMVINSQPTFATAGRPMAQTLVQVEDQFGNPVANSDEVTASIYDSSSDGELLGTLTVKVKNGITTFIVGNCAPRIGLLGVCSQFCRTLA